MAISDKPWQYSEADYTPDQWYRATLVHIPPAGGQDKTVKSLNKLAVREPDGTLNRNGVHAAAQRFGQVQAPADLLRQAARELMQLYNELGEDPPQSIMDAAGHSMAMGRSETYLRSWVLDDINIISRNQGGDGRTVEAYAAIFDTPAEIRDQHGHYNETINRGAFNKTLQENKGNVQVLYNHGLTTHGTPDGLLSVPLGRPVDVRADSKGLLTITRYNKSALADSVLESIRNGDIRAQSFRGRIYKSNPARVPRATKSGTLPIVTRMELGLSDYGPTPTPAYDGANIVAVRNVQALAEDIARLGHHDIAELIRTLASTTPAEPETTHTTPHRGAGTEEPQQHSVRQRLLRLRAEARFKGI